MNPSLLAINGGTPVRTKPWRESNAIGAEEKEAVLRVLDHGRLSLFLGTYKPQAPYNFRGGPEVLALEALASEKLKVKHVVAVNSATSGLNAAIGALGLGFGDEVIVSPYTMSACAVAPLWYGAVPVFADVERETGCLDPVSIRERITPRTKAILVVHQFGIPANLGEILNIAKEHNLKIIEDCAQAWGAKFEDRSVGTIGDIGVFSFNVHKTIQCGEGGLCVTNDDETALRLQLIRNHGESVVEAAGVTNLTNLIGGNFRITEIQAAIAREQLKKLDGLNATRIALVEQLSEGLKKHSCLATPFPSPERQATYYVYPLRFLKDQSGGRTRAEFARMLKAEGMSFSEGYVRPLYHLPVFRSKTAFRRGYPWNAPVNDGELPSYAENACPVAEHLFAEEMLLNQHICPPQNEEDIGDIVKAVDKVLA